MPEHSGRKAVMEVSFRAEPFCKCIFNTDGPALGMPFMLGANIPIDISCLFKFNISGNGDISVYNFGDRPVRPIVKLGASARNVTLSMNGKSLAFTFDDKGMRLPNTVDGVTHTYSLDGDRIVAEEWGNQLLVYFYDDAGLPMGMMYRNSSYADKQFDYYLYEKDVFGNIIAIYNASGTKVASYCY